MMPRHSYCSATLAERSTVCASQRPSSRKKGLFTSIDSGSRSRIRQEAARVDAENLTLQRSLRELGINLSNAFQSGHRAMWLARR